MAREIRARAGSERLSRGLTVSRMPAAERREQLLDVASELFSKLVSTTMPKRSAIMVANFLTALSLFRLDINTFRSVEDRPRKSARLALPDSPDSGNCAISINARLAAMIFKLASVTSSASGNDSTASNKAMSRSDAIPDLEDGS